jgi:hypothetical protein
MRKSARPTYLTASYQKENDQDLSRKSILTKHQFYNTIIANCSIKKILDRKKLGLKNFCMVIVKIVIIVMVKTCYVPSKKMKERAVMLIISHFI